jgi:hypothetical protein
MAENWKGKSLPYRILILSVKWFMRHTVKFIYGLTEPFFIMDQYGWELGLFFIMDQYGWELGLPDNVWGKSPT